MAKGLLATPATVGAAFQDAGYPGTDVTIQKIGKGGHSLKVAFKTAGGITGSFSLGTGLLPHDQKARVVLVKHVVSARRAVLSR